MNWIKVIFQGLFDAFFGHVGRWGYLVFQVFISGVKEVYDGLFLTFIPLLNLDQFSGRISIAEWLPLRI